MSHWIWSSLAGTLSVPLSSARSRCERVEKDEPKISRREWNREEKAKKQPPQEAHYRRPCLTNRWACKQRTEQINFKLLKA